MCGRFAAQLPPEFIRRLFRTHGDLPNIAANWNVAPTQPAMVIRLDPHSRQRSLDVLQWGLVPYFTKDLKKAQRPINARAESVASSAMFRAAFAKRRCLVPADAFYEWRAMADGKQPYAIGRADGAPLAFAGLWEAWRANDGEMLRSFTILTTTANTPMAALHTRMPVILEEDDWRAWLGEVDRDPLALLRPAEDDVLRIWPVSRAVNNARHNGAALLDEVDDPKAPDADEAPPGANPA
jgi:putative SOS response-associated peptidase YedK